MRQTISFFAQRDATADYQAHKQRNCVPRSTKAFRRHVESRVARFLQEGRVFFRSYDPPMRKLHRGGYGYTTPVAGIVIGDTSKRVRIAVYTLRTQQIEEKLVYPASLSPRANHSDLDDAMERF
jgi:hypothetical protein